MKQMGCLYIAVSPYLGGIHTAFLLLANQQMFVKHGYRTKNRKTISVYDIFSGDSQC